MQLGPGYSGSSVGVPEGSSQVSLSSRHSSMLGTSQEADVGGYRGHTAAAPHYGGQYSSVYSSATLSGAQQVSDFNCIVYVSFHVAASKLSIVFYGNEGLHGYHNFSSAAISDQLAFVLCCICI